MDFKLEKKKLGSLNYFQKGPSPTLLLMSGTHGDEYEVIEPLTRIIDKYLSELPDLIFIPQVSPSAVQLKTRVNKSGHDVNRKFFGDTDDSEARTVMKIISQYKFSLGISFHEDYERESFYLYDSAKLDLPLLNNLKKSVRQLGIRLYTGIDDTQDVTLFNKVINGYLSIPGDSQKVIYGDFWDWSLSLKIVRRLLYPEIPMRLPLHKKTGIVELLFTDLIFPLLEN